MSSADDRDNVAPGGASTDSSTGESKKPTGGSRPPLTQRGGGPGAGAAVAGAGSGSGSGSGTGRGRGGGGASSGESGGGGGGGGTGSSGASPGRARRAAAAGVTIRGGDDGSGADGIGGESAEEWLVVKFGTAPKTSLGWLRAGIGFHNKTKHHFAIDCLNHAVQLDPTNFNAYQVMARSCIAVNRREEAIRALKQSVRLNNPSDWQLLTELTSDAEASATY